MKIYIDSRRKGNKVVYGVTAYNDKGHIVHSEVKNVALTEQEGVRLDKFRHALKSLDWSVNLLQRLVHNKKIPNEPLFIFIPSKTVYTWLMHDASAESYAVEFGELLTSLSFLQSRTEIMYSESAARRVTFKNSIEDKPSRVSDIF